MELNDKTILKAEDLQLISADQAWHYQIIPAGKNGSGLSLFTSNSDPSLVDELEILFGSQIELNLVDAEIIKKALGKYYRRDQQEKNRVTLNFSGNSENFISDLIAEARGLQSSDIHMEVYED